MGLVDRVKNILLNPRQEWEVIDGEAATVASLYTGYIIPLAAITPISQAIGYSVFGIRLPFVGTWRTPIGSAITSAIVTYVLTLVGVYLLHLIIDNLAPTFGGTRNAVQALKVSAYSYTAAWVCGIFALIPGLRFLTILGLYSLYLLYLGLPILMKSPKEKALSYTAVAIIVAIIISFVIGAVASRFIASPTMGGYTP
jgi:Yip1 domain